MSRADTWMPASIGEYLARTGHLTAREHGAYLLLCMHHAMTGGIPETDAELAEITRCDRRAWRQMKQKIFGLFASSSGAPTPFKFREVRSWDDRRLPPEQWRIVRYEVFERDNFTCVYCGERGGSLECDHVIPVSRGGSNEKSNLATACQTCNRRKHAKTADEWLAA